MSQGFFSIGGNSCFECSAGYTSHAKSTSCTIVAETSEFVTNEASDSTLEIGSMSNNIGNSTVETTENSADSDRSSSGVDGDTYESPESLSFSAIMLIASLSSMILGGCVYSLSVKMNNNDFYHIRSVGLGLEADVLPLFELTELNTIHKEQMF